MPIYVVELKSFKHKLFKLFKYKIAFSAQALADTSARPVYPIVSLVYTIRRKEPRLIAALLEPPAEPGEPYPVHEMRISKTLTLKLT